jgi:hypothetical protein
MRLQLSVLCLAAMLAPPSQADNVVIGSGSPASCTDAAINAALPLLVNGVGGQGPGGVMSFNCGPAFHIITVNTQKFLSGQILIDGASKVALDGQHSTRLLHVALANPGDPEDRTEVTLRNLTMVNAFAQNDFGGAVLVRNGARLDVDGVTIAASRAGLAGGAIGAEPGTLLNISASIFNNNSAATSAGAIATSAITTINDSSFSENVTDTGQGGAIQSWVAPLTIHGSTFADNRAGIGGASGVGGAIYKQQSEMLMTHSVLVNNRASNDGGALMLWQTSSTIDDSDIRNNRASDFLNGGTGRGGGIYLGEDANVLTRRTVIEGNQAFHGGGAYASALNQGAGSTVVAGQNLRFWQNSRILGNSASSGGGVYVAGIGLFNSGRIGRLSLLDSSVNDNVALANGGGIFSQGELLIGLSQVRSNQAAQNGGGIYLAPTFVGTASVTDTETGLNTFDRATIDSNIAGAYGGGVFATFAKMNVVDASVIRANRAEQRGGGIALQDVYHFPLQRVSLIENRAELAGGGIYVERALNTVIVERSTFSANRTINSSGSGGQLFATTATAFGPSRVFLFDTTFYGGISPSGSNLHADAGSQISFERSVIATLGSNGCSTFGDGLVATLGENVLMGFSCPFDVNSDIGVATEASLKLSALADNGGFAPTHLPATGSPIIDNHNCPPPPPGNTRLDQRGFSTGIDGDGDLVGLCDAGAVERQTVEGGAIFGNGFE